MSIDSDSALDKKKANDLLRRATRMIENYDIQNLGPGRGDEVHRIHQILPDSVLHRFTIYVPPVTRDFFLTQRSWRETNGDH